MSKKYPYVETDGLKWHQRTLHIQLDSSLQDLWEGGYGPHKGVGTITLHLQDGVEVDISSSQEHALTYRDGNWNDIRGYDESTEE